MASGRRQYPFHLIEPKWQQFWNEQQTFRAFNPGEVLPDGHPFAQRHHLSGRVAATQLPPKFYILDMFPYPSGAGLHVGHPEGYTATDILARYKRAQGFHVLHPMGWDAFGLPAEQYAVKTGQHPRQTTEANIATFKRQIQSLGFSYDWSRELATTDPDYFKWTQWIFLKLYNSWFNPETNRAEKILTLKYPKELDLPSIAKTSEGREKFEKNFDLEAQELWIKRHAYRDSKRLAYVAEAPVWWCEELGTVLANEEVVDGKSEVGGHPVKRRWLVQWTLRITAYAGRLLKDLDTIEWSNSLKEMQRNWIGQSEGADVIFEVINVNDAQGKPFTLRVFTTRPDTLFGATYMVVAPEHELISRLTELGQPWPDKTPENWKGSLINGRPFDTPAGAMLQYWQETLVKGELERTSLSKEKTGIFTGVYARNPVNNKEVPIFVADYVLGGYGTGAIMAVPAHDERDFEFAKKFKLPITPVVMPPQEWLEKYVADYVDISGESVSTKHKRFIDLRDEDYFQAVKAAFCEDGIAINSSTAQFTIDGLKTENAKWIITEQLEFKSLGKKTINYKLRDWLFSRQRYWGEPFPIVWKKDGPGGQQPHHEALPESELPVLPPELSDYKPTATGEPPLARAKDWVNLPDGSTRETNTMPQWAGSCWYYLRFLDAKNPNGFVGKEAERYWMGSNPSTLNPQPPTKSTPGVDLYVGGTEHAVLHLLYARFWHKVLFDLGYVSTPEPFFKLVNQGLILGEDGQKMSKSRGNVVNPDDILQEYGADAFRLYEMFMGPLEMVKPWSTKGVEGVYRFLGRVWRLFVDEKSETEFEQAETTTKESSNKELLEIIKLNPAIKDMSATPAQLKVLHTCIKKVTEDLDGLRFNTAISALMVFVNDAITWETKPVVVLRDFLILLQPFAPHLAEELWAKLHASRITHHAPSLAYALWPKFNPALLVESEIEIPVQVNGKLRDVIKVPANAAAAALEAAARASEKVKPFLAGKTIRKVIVVPTKLVNIVVA